MWYIQTAIWVLHNIESKKQMLEKIKQQKNLTLKPMSSVIMINMDFTNCYIIPMFDFHSVGHSGS